MLLAAYPEEFRREYGAQMEQTFQDLCREERRKSEAAGFLRLWIRTLLDLRSGQASSGWTWLKEGSAEGFLVGGCLESMQHLRGTPYWPDLDGAILFLETSEEKPEPEGVDGILMDYENMGVFG